MAVFPLPRAWPVCTALLFRRGSPVSLLLPLLLLISSYALLFLAHHVSAAAAPSGSHETASDAATSTTYRRSFLSPTPPGHDLSPLDHVGVLRPSVDVRCLDSERSALLRFKAGLDDPDGQLRSWRGLYCCRWAGVTCDNHTGSVIKVDLGKDKLSGRIDPSLLGLKCLRHLDLSGNSFHHIPIPDFVVSFQQLRYLNLSHSGFTGTIPPQLGNLSSLQYLDLSSGDADAAGGLLRADNLGWLSGLSSLRYLALDGVNLSMVGADWVQQLSERLPLLAQLHLRNCSLGLIAPSLLHPTNFTSPRVIDLSFNLLSSTVSISWLPNVSSLVYVDMGSNNLHGPVPVGFSELPYLRYLNLGFNQNLSANISELLGRGGWRNINTLRIRSSSLYGEIPASIGNISSLAYLDLGFNSIRGGLPPAIRRLSELTYLNVRNNQLTGVMTEAHFSSLCKLKVLGLEGNSLTGEIPMSIGRLRSLRLLVLSRNKLTGGIPGSIGEMDMLLCLDLSENNLTGRIPTSIGKLHSLWLLDFSKNHLTGGIPTSIGKLRNLGVLDLSRNNLTGSIPTSIGKLHNLQVFDFSENNLTGSIPPSIGKLHDLVFLDLSENNLSDGIPTTLFNCSSLQALSLGGNCLSGEVPTMSLNRLPMKDLVMLNISNNMLSGRFPSFIRHLSALRALVLARNKLHGNIPAWIGDVQNLTILQLGSNKLSGEIPCRLSNLKSLRILDLRGNNLSGPIPKQLGNPEAMLEATKFFPQTWVVHVKGRRDLKYLVNYNSSPRTLFVHVKGRDIEYEIKIGSQANTIDLSGNKLSGEFSESFINLSGLVVLDLSRNFLTEMIPERIGEMRALESLDLSGNHFTGRIPPSMASLSFLGYLNLSNNNFSGEIPVGGKLLTFIDSAFRGNPYLCGPLLHRSCVSGYPQLHHVVDASKDGEEATVEADALYMGLGVGFAFGLLGPFLILLIKRGWSEAYFRAVDLITDRLFY